MANLSNVWSKLRVSNPDELEKAIRGKYISIELDREYILFDPWIEKIDDNIYELGGSGRWYFGSEAIKNINGVSELLEYTESENGSNFYNYLSDGKELSEEYFCEEHISDVGVDFFITHYEECFDSKEDAQEVIDELEKHRPELKNKKEWWKILIYNCTK